jgi:lysophospholipase L1-like esterase
MGRSAPRTLYKAIAGTVAFIVVGDLTLRLAYLARNHYVDAVPLPYTLGDDYGPQPPWLDSTRMLEPDDRLIWRNRSGFRQNYVDLFIPFRSNEARLELIRRFSPRLPQSVRHQPRWDVALDSRGFRATEFTDHKARDTVRILCLGDSWTFGANVPQEQTYPQQLGRLLERRFPGGRFEVLNLGVLGYSSFQGRELLRSHAIDWDPDFVILGFGMNDGKVGYRDKDVVAAHPGPWQRAAAWLEQSEVYKLLRYWALLARHRAPSTADAFRGQIALEKYARKEHPDALEPTRVSVADYERNLSDMIDVARGRGAGVIVLDNEMDGSAYGAAMARVTSEKAVPLIRSDRLIALERSRSAAQRARQLGLRASTDQMSVAAEPTLAPAARSSATGTTDVEVVFRASLAGNSVGGALYLVGDHPALGDLVPNRVALHDDGRAGDEVGGDGVWSYKASLPAGRVIHYAYTSGGSEGVWEGLDVPAIRRFVVPGTSSGPVYRPLESFGAIDLQSDSWHTDAKGLGLIAEAVAAVLDDDPRVKRLGGERWETNQGRAASRPGTHRRSG